MLPRPDPFIDPLVVNTVRAQKAALLQAERATMADLTGRWLAMESRLAPAFDALALDIMTAQAQGQVITSNWLLSSSRFQALVGQANSELLNFINFADQLIVDQQYFFGSLALSDATETLGLGLTEYGRLSNFATLTDDTLYPIVGRAGNGQPIMTLLDPTREDALKGMAQKVLEASRRKVQDPTKLLQSMQNGLAHGYNRVLNTSRSESLRVYRNMVRSQWSTSGLVDEYMRVATHDSRVCAGCLMAEGTRYAIGEEMPEHPQGRCGQVPVIKGQPRPTWLGSGRWLETQDEATQIAILGPGRYNAWTAGKFSLDQLPKITTSAEWGPGLATTPLKDLV